MVSEFPKYRESNLTIVAARPAMGRVRYLCALANDRAKSHHVLINSFAFSERHLRTRYRLDNANITIDDTPSPTIAELGCIIHNAVKNHDIKTVVIDYLNLLSGSIPDMVLSTLKSWCKELNIEIIAGVSVKMVKRNEVISAPTLDKIEMNGTEVIDEFISLHNPEYYLPRTRHSYD